MDYCSIALAGHKKYVRKFAQNSKNYLKILQNMEKLAIFLENQSDRIEKMKKIEQKFRKNSYILFQML